MLKINKIEKRKQWRKSMKPEWVLVVSIRLVNFLLREKERNISYQYQV